MAKKVKLSGSEFEDYLKNKKNSGNKNIFEFLKKNYLTLIIFLIILVINVVVNIVPTPLETVKDSVVKVEVYNDSNELLSTGSGFCAYEPNYIVTNFHVIEGASSIKIISDDNLAYDVNKVLIFDSKNDLAILETEASLKPIKLGSVSNLKSGSKIRAIGSPLSELNTVSEGIISNADNQNGIQISAAVDHGSSGGVLLNKRNRAIGVVYASLNEGKSLNYAISIKYLKQMKENLDDNNVYFINESNYYECIPSFSEVNLSNGKPEFNCDSDKEYYSIDNIKLLSEMTDIEKIYEYNISDDGWGNIYNSLSKKRKKKVTKLYEQLVNEKFCEDECNISSEIKSWNVSQFFINLDILEKEELALVTVDMEKYNSVNSQFKRVEDYPLTAAQMCLIRYYIGDAKWSDIHPDNKKDIFKFLDKKGFDTKDLGAILKIIGYTVKYESDGTLTAYWD